LLSVSDTVKFMFIAEIAMCHYYVAYDKWDDKRICDDDDDDDDVYGNTYSYQVAASVSDKWLIGFGAD